MNGWIPHLPALRCIVAAHNCSPAYRQRCGDRSFVRAIHGVTDEAIAACWVDGAFDPFAAAALWADSFNTVSEGYAFEIEIACLPASGGDLDLVTFSEFLSSRHLCLKGVTNGIDPRLKGPEAEARP